MKNYIKKKTFKYDTEKFIKKAKEIHGEKYDYSKTIYIKINQKVIISCPFHGEFQQTPTGHIRSVTGCEKCGKVSPKRRELVYNDKYREELKNWRSMIRRCYFSNHHSVVWEYYGGRGIKVCDRWRNKKFGTINGFENFINDMGPKPSPKHSIDRIDNTGNYEPGNCRWATHSEQILNQRKQTSCSGILGITKSKNNVWIVAIIREGITYYGGTFKEIKDAKNKLFEIKSLINKGIKFDNNIKYVNMKSPKGVNSSEVK